MHQVVLALRVVTADVMDVGPVGYQQIRVQEHEAAGFRAGKRQRLVNKLVDQEALARIIGAGLGEILVTKLHLNLAKLFLVVKRARPGRPIFT